MTVLVLVLIYSLSKKLPNLARISCEVTLIVYTTLLIVTELVSLKY
jgi:hypothetical protein